MANDKHKTDNLWKDLNKIIKQAKFEQQCKMMKVRNQKRNDEEAKARRAAIPRKKKYSVYTVQMTRALHIARKEIKGTALTYAHIWQVIENLHQREGGKGRVTMDFIRKAAKLEGYRTDAIPTGEQLAYAKVILQKILDGIDNTDLRYKAEQETGIKDYYSPNKPTDIYAVDSDGNKQYPNQNSKQDRQSILNNLRNDK